MQIRIITLHQPWATLLAAGILKKNETRPKAANYSPDDIVLIHAAVQFHKWVVDYNDRDHYNTVTDYLNDLGYKGLRELPYGAVVGEFKVKEFIESEGMWMAGYDTDPIELFLGNYDPGRSIWIGTNHRLLKEPYPYKNGQGYYQKFKGDYNDLNFNYGTSTTI